MGNLHALLYVKDAITWDDMTAAARDMADALHVEIFVFPPEPKQFHVKPQFNVERDGTTVACRLIVRGDYGDWYLDQAQENGVPYRPQAIIPMEVFMKPPEKIPMAIQLASEVVAFFVRRWTIVIDNSLPPGERHIYTAEEILANSRDGTFPY